MLATAVLPSQGLLENLAWSLRLPIDELDQPELAEVLAVWRAKHREARLPPRAAFDATDLKRAISHVMILDGAVANVVGIRRGALSGNIRISS
ncbi:MAG: hypothetical protein FJX35_23930 [Alphaproteobacteria bacterium]|nr:hypothetical protein [Alphaproteobacteria bacterium]